MANRTMGRPKDDIEHQRVTLRLPEELIDELYALSSHEKRSLSRQCQLFLEDGIRVHRQRQALIERSVQEITVKP